MQENFCFSSLRKFLLIFFTFIIFNLSFSQINNQLEGHWKGYFYEIKNGTIDSKNYYDFDVFIEKDNTVGLKGITISKNRANYLGKAYASISLVKSNGTLVLSEYKLANELKKDASDLSCLLTCTFKLNGGNWSNNKIQGTFTSTNGSNLTNCSNGLVFLEKIDNFSDLSHIDQVKRLSRKYCLNDKNDKNKPKNNKIANLEKNTELTSNEEKQIDLTNGEVNKTTQNNFNTTSEAIRPLPPVFSGTNSANVKIYKIIKYLNKEQNNRDSLK